jgi:hypothetical protein
VDLAVRELHGDLNGDLAVGGPEDGADVVGQLQAVDRAVEVEADDVEVGDLGALGGLGLARGRLALPVLLHGGRGLVGLLPVAARLPVFGLGCHQCSSGDGRQHGQSLTGAFKGLRIPALQS